MDGWMNADGSDDLVGKPARQESAISKQFTVIVGDNDIFKFIGIF
jgi:hypothetical protein